MIVDRMKKVKLYLVFIVFMLLLSCSNTTTSDTLTRVDAIYMSKKHPLKVLKVLNNFGLFDTIIFGDAYFEVYKLKPTKDKPYVYLIEKYIIHDDSVSLEKSYSKTSTKRFNQVCHECGNEHEDKMINLYSIARAQNFSVSLDSTKDNVFYKIKADSLTDKYVMLSFYTENCLFGMCYTNIELNYFELRHSADYILSFNPLLKNIDTINGGVTGLGFFYPIHKDKDNEYGYLLFSYSDEAKELINKKMESVWINNNYTFVIVKNSLNNG